MEQVILVDRDDNQIGQVEKLYAHKHCLLHRAFSIFIYRFNGDKAEYLIHKRNRNKYHSGGLWTNSCCSHPRPLENLLDATSRRLKEEIGIRAKLDKIGSYYYKAKLGEEIFEHEIDHIFIGQWLGDKIEANPEEIEDIAWKTAAEIDTELKHSPKTFTTWFKPVFDLVKEHRQLSE